MSCCKKNTILYIDSCVRRDSRTERLAQALLEKLDGDVQHLRLEDLSFEPSDEAFLKKRDQHIEEGEYADEMFDLAKQFAAADVIVISAPYWDLSFPASLKQYIEKICVTGITFEYTPEGIPKGLCRAQRLYYVMTAGGDYAPEEYGYGYIQALSRGYFGITDFRLIKATGLDIVGANAEKIIQDCIEHEIPNLFNQQS